MPLRRSSLLTRPVLFSVRGKRTSLKIFLHPLHASSIAGLVVKIRRKVRCASSHFNGLRQFGGNQAFDSHH